MRYSFITRSAQQWKSTFGLMTLALTLLLGGSCDDKDDPVVCTTLPDPSERVVFITNEGNFQFGNSSLSRYDIAEGTVFNRIFESVNGQPLGDVLQSMKIFEDRMYLVVNNSSKIEVVDLQSTASLGTITGFNSPRYILPLSSEKAYVSELFSGQMSIVNLNQMQITGTISIPGWTEEMLLVENEVWVTNVNRDYIYIIDPTSDQVTDSILVGRGSESLVRDQNGKVWVLCQGSATDVISGKLNRINPTNHQVELALDFASGENPLNLRINGNGDRLYYINSGIHTLGISENALPASPFIAANNSIFYGLGIDPEDETIYVADAIDYVQEGVVFRYNASGSLIDQFDVEVIPSEFYFHTFVE